MIIGLENQFSVFLRVAILYRFYCSLYSTWAKISNNFLLLFLNKMLFIRSGIHKMHVRIANREDPGQTASSKL